MTSVFKVLWKIFVSRFYIINAGFFLFSFILIFGIVHPPQLIEVHRSLILGIIQSNLFTWVVLLLWFIYNLKCIFFCLRIIQKEDDTILFNLQSLPALKQCFLLFICHCCLYLPVIIYSGFVIYMATQKMFYLYIMGLIFFQLVMCLLAVGLYYNNINFSWKPPSVKTSISTRIKPVFQIWPLTYLLYYIFNERKIVLFVIKLTGIFLLDIILSSDKASFIMRDFVLVYMIVVLIHSLIVYYCVEFIENRMSSTRNLPVSRWQRLLLMLFTYLLLLLPEACFVFINGFELIPVDILLKFYGLAVAELLLFTATLYLGKMTMKPYLKMVFCIYFISSILLLSGNYLSVCLVELIAAVVVFYLYYYKYESVL